jgi:hypothetical protein
LAKKAKKIPGNFSFKTHTNTDLPNRLDPALEIVFRDKMTAQPTLDLSIPILREIQEFPQEATLAPHFHFENTLYVYPDTVNFSNRSGKVRNISLRIFLKDGDNESLVSSLANIYGKSSGLVTRNSVVTQVTWHNKVKKQEYSFG